MSEMRDLPTLERLRELRGNPYDGIGEMSDEEMYSLIDAAIALRRLEAWLRVWVKHDVLLFKSDLDDDSIRIDLDDGADAGKGWPGRGLQSTAGPTLLAALTAALNKAEGK